MSLHNITSDSEQSNIIAIRDGQIKDVFYPNVKDEVPAFATVVDYEEEEEMVLKEANN